MGILIQCLLFFFIGVIEFALDMWEKLVSTRLKFWATMGFGALNQYFDFFLNIFFFGMIISFWEKWHSGAHDYKTLLPYLAYMTGRIFGTGGAVLVYARNKKKRDKDKAINILVNAKKGTKKKKGKKSKTKNTPTDVGHLFDSIEVNDVKDEIKARVIETATQKISDKIDAALTEENQNG